MMMMMMMMMSFLYLVVLDVSGKSAIAVATLNCTICLKVVSKLCG